MRELFKLMYYYYLYDFLMVTRHLRARHLRATRKNDTYARPHPHQIHCAQVSRAQMSCHVSLYRTLLFNKFFYFNNR